MLKVVAIGLLIVMAMGLFTAWVHRKMHSGRYAPDVTAAPAATKRAFTPPATIEMEPVVDWMYGGYTHLLVGALAIAFWLFTRETAWLRLLAWPAGLVALLFAGLSVHGLWNEFGTRYVADATGLQIHDRAGGKSIPWSRVIGVRLTEYYVPIGSSTHHQAKSLHSRRIDLLGADGSSMLMLDLPLRPPEASASFEASLPIWTGKTTEIRQVGK